MSPSAPPRLTLETPVNYLAGVGPRRAELLKRLPLSSNRFGFEVEVTARLAQAGARVWEMPISYSGRTYAEGKKITWRDGVAALFHILRYNLFVPRSLRDWRSQAK